MYLLKDRSMNEVIKQFNKFLKDVDYKVNILNSDNEFNNQPF